MISTSLAVAALTGLLATGSLSGSTSWQTDYRTALQLSVAQQKPLVVVIHTGGASQLFQGPTVPLEAVAAVRQNYVGLSVDPSTPEGSHLANLFRMQEGVVISDKTGAVQALRYEGSVTVPQVAPYLTRYAGMTQPPAQTEYVYRQVSAPIPSYNAYPQVVQSQPGLFQQPGPINNLITRPVTNVFNATRSLVIGGG
jgi:hypothetical protein